MRIEVNGCRLFVDVVGSGLVAAGTSMCERPVVISSWWSWHGPYDDEA